VFKLTILVQLNVSIGKYNLWHSVANDQLWNQQTLCSYTLSRLAKFLWLQWG